MAELADLRADYERINAQWRNGDPTARIKAGRAYNAWFHASCQAGEPPDAMDRYDKNELRRFLAKTIPGMDGHVYYGPRSGFVKNDGKRRNPRTYWWEKINGPLIERGAIKPTCGEPHCIVPEHQRFVPWSEIKALFSDGHCVGALQVAAQRLGKTPTADEYDKLGLKPSSSMITGRFAGWVNAIKAAGLVPLQRGIGGYAEKWSNEDCLAAIRSVHSEHGFTPTGIWWTRNKLVPSESTIVRRFGGWGKALIAAGLK